LRGLRPIGEPRKPSLLNHLASLAAAGLAPSSTTMQKKNDIIQALNQEVEEIIELISDDPGRLAYLVLIAIESLADVTEDAHRLLPLMKLCETLHKLELVEKALSEQSRGG
jgi:hypothetical protein